MHAKELLDQLNNTDEHSKLEAKRGSQIGDSILETICAFSNEPGLGGGYLLLGVREITDTLFEVMSISCKPNLLLNVQQHSTYLFDLKLNSIHYLSKTADLKQM